MEIKEKDIPTDVKVLLQEMRIGLATRRELELKGYDFSQQGLDLDPFYGVYAGGDPLATVAVNTGKHYIGLTMSHLLNGEERYMLTGRVQAFSKKHGYEFKP